MSPLRRKRRLVPAIAALIVVLATLAYTGTSIVVAGRLWHPVRYRLHTTPAQYGLAYENATFASTVDDVPLSGWLIGSPSTSKGTIVVMHGTDGVRDNFISMEVSRALVQHGYSIFMFDFRAQGESGGSIGTLGLLETRDLEGAIAHLQARGVQRVGVIGYSMGAATALRSAPVHPEIAAIVADSSFADLPTVMENEGRAIGIPPGIEPGVILASRLFYGLDPLADRPIDAMSRLGDRPVLLVQCSGDSVVPPGQAYELQMAGAGNPNLQLWVAQGAGHVGAFASNKAEYINRVSAFFDRYLAHK